ncbi:MFS transporter [Glaesserella parasuis]|uniref:MFS transporter n=1 Tax=Glaesserella parasuis TaxID=738 RepID=UPI0024367C9F|nr:MFS transporter [Glaesserella parasuis]MDG6457500.1 MFS transporter [Glaesserella parasuis]MDG6789853.1 MFS transporter [Glaesserella parasuis]MDG6807678.1 MFS transporter [Glaesserella parasuis]
MNNYEKIIASYVSTSSARMLIGASSTVYMLISNISLYQIGLIKSLQAIIILFLGFVIGIVSDRVERKKLYLIAIFFAVVWLLLFYIAGIIQSFEIFLLAEIFNAISLAIFQNNSNAYLVEQYIVDKPDGNLSEAFGKLGKYDFFVMAIFSLLGGMIYSIINGYVFGLASFIMLIILFLSWRFLPKCKRSLAKKKRYISKLDFAILNKKFKKYRFEVVVFVILSLYFQIIIQYWQVVVYNFDLIKEYEFLLGVLLFFMLIAQSLAGKLIETNKTKILNFMPFLFMGSVFLCLFGELIQSFILYSFGICLSLFSIRHTLIKIDAILHHQLLSRFRAKYDMLLNSIVRIVSALGLILIGHLSEIYGVITINFVGVLIGILFSIMIILYRDKRNTL